MYNFDAVRATVCELFVTKSISQISSLCHYAACVRDSGSSMWIYVFLGNALRGIGETPVTPLGISYIDDFAKAENSPFYIGNMGFKGILKSSTWLKRCYLINKFLKMPYKPCENTHIHHSCMYSIFYAG